MMRCAGTWSTAIIELLVRYGTSLIPGMSGTAARPPTLMKILSAVSARPPTSSVRSAVKRAWPRIRVTFFMPAIQLSSPSVDCFTTPSLRAFTAFMSTRTPPAAKPYSPPRRAMWIARALPTSVLVGMQPTLTQVPPRSLRSTIAVFRPSAPRRAVRAGPACPATMTTASKCSGTRIAAGRSRFDRRMDRLFTKILRAQIDRRAFADVLVGIVQPRRRRRATPVAQLAEKIPARIHLALNTQVAHHPVRANRVDQDVLQPFSVLVLEPALLGQLGDDGDDPQFADQRGIEGNFIEPVLDFVRGGRQLRPHDRIDMHDDDIAAARVVDERIQGRGAHVTAVPVVLAADFDRLEHGRHAGRGEHHVDRQFARAKDARLGAAHIGGTEEQLDAVAGPHRLHVDVALQPLAQRLEVERIELLRRKQPCEGLQDHAR